VGRLTHTERNSADEAAPQISPRLSGLSRSDLVLWHKADPPGRSGTGPVNDPHQEHDFGSFNVEGETIFFKIDYYDCSLECHSPDPADPVVTRRVITLMLASEY
jgi:hypothetical protein